MSNREADSFDCGAAATGAWRAQRASGRLRALRRHATAVARLALPQRCQLCVAKAGAELLCAACIADLPRVTVACLSCALPASGGAVCGACLAHPPPWSRAIAALVYAFPVDRLLQELKYDGRLALADWAGETLARSVVAAMATRPAPDRPDRIVALPLASSRQRERGFNQAREIAVRVAQATGLPLTAPLVRMAGAKPQAALAWKERAQNVRGAFGMQGDVRGARIAVVDDVMTTGATLAEAARVLAHAGAADVECWVVARTLRG